MNLTVKTLKGEKFVVEAEASNTIAEVKAIIETARTEMKAAGMKLIHSGKILKDADTVEACNIKPTDFLVVMLTKAKKQAAAPAPAPVAAPAPAAPAPAAATTTTSTTATESASSTASSTAATATSSEFPAEVVAGLTGMGFPQDMALACLRAAQGNPDVAVEYLTNGIPDAAAAVAASTSSTSAATAPAASSSSSSDPLAALRAHPQLNQLRRLVQTNPQALQAVLSQIGQQQPELLQAINANQAGFLELMNEPVVEDSAPSNAASAAASVPPSGTAGTAGVGGLPGMGGMGGMPNPADMARMLAGLSEPEINQMAGVMGLTPQQLMATAQAIGNMPPEQFQQHMMQAMQQGGMGGPAGGGMPGQHVVRLTDEEMASVDRLTEMGFDRTEAVQAFLACDKNEALAANLLMDSMNDGGFGGGFGGGGSGGGGNPEGPGDGDDMYD